MAYILKKNYNKKDFKKGIPKFLPYNRKYKKKENYLSF